MEEINRSEINEKCAAALLRFGVKRPKQTAEISVSEQTAEENHTEIQSAEDLQMESWIKEVSSFIKSYDFMRLGQAVGHGQWQAAAMTIRRMDMQAKKVGAECFLRQFAGLKQTVARKNEHETKQILVSVTAKRVKIIEALNERERMLH